MVVFLCDSVCGSLSARVQDNDKAITTMRLEFERECRELQLQYEERMKVRSRLVGH